MLNASACFQVLQFILLTMKNHNLEMIEKEIIKDDITIMYLYVALVKFFP